ncbi:putative glycosylphosphatidylinositol-alpha 1,2 mannosyltransferase [Aspergillus chevalieri]|uniref:Mannosyltransferase n=1 Tax=Aspergillus chevalieri TaxID=182096 RepID=A0A7R7ZIG8_ASPCH|nr:glycosylphosphatidylinositol anchor biosynthesis [Aspergillus chevalieri]BCR83238.1 glycosylphosphatidylinositol anchor biosynthesis [Aspergillus chevalieri]
MASRSGRSSSGRSSSKLLSYLSSNTSSAPPPSSSSKPRRSKASSSSSSGSVKESSPREPPRSSLPPLREYREYRESRRPKETRETRPSRDTREKESREPREITPSTVFLSLIAFRLINALLVRTFFQPDEFFQSLEPAWQLAFGKDQGAWMTWEWRNQLRSSLHPLLFAAVYRVAALLAFVLRLSPTLRANLLIAAPKTAQAVIAAVGDFYTWKFARRIHGDGSRKNWAVLALTVASPWQWFCSTRTLSNCLETTITVVALDLWPWEWSLDSELKAARKSRSSRTQERLDKELLNRLRQCLCLAALACILRPTNILIWVTLAGIVLYRNSWEIQKILAREVAICGSAILSVSTLVDRLFYGVWTFPPFKFLYFNIVQSLAVFYGKNDFHYYVSQGLPLLLTTALPFSLLGLYRSANRPPSSASKHWRTNIQTQLAYVCLAMPLVLSLISHKEVRFIYPILPSLHILSATPLLETFYPAVSRSSRIYTPRRLTLIFILIVNVFIALYTTIYHASGTINVLSYLRDQHDRHTTPNHAQSPSSGPGISTGFLMPCHSTPWRSHMVYPSINAWALSCEPPVNLNASEKATYVDEADQFYENPTTFLRQNMLGGLWHIPRKPSYLSKPSNRRNPKGYHEWPDYLVFFAQLEPTLQRLLKSSAYGECYRTFSTAWHDDWRRKGDVVVWCLDPGEQQSWKTVLKEREERAQRKLLDFDIDLSPITQTLERHASTATKTLKTSANEANIRARKAITNIRREIESGKWTPAFLQQSRTQSGVKLSWPSWGKTTQKKTLLERVQRSLFSKPSSSSWLSWWDTKGKKGSRKGKRELWS